MDIKKLIKYSKYIRKHRISLFWIFVFSLILSVSALFHTMLLSTIIDNILVVKDISSLGIILLIIVCIYLIQLALKYVVGLYSVRITQMVSVNMRIDVLKNVFYKKVSAIQKENNSEMVSTLLSDVQLISNFLCTRPIQIINSLITIAITFFLILVLNSKMAIIAIASILVQLLVSYNLSVIAKNNQKEIRKKESQHLEIVKQLFENLKYIKSYGIEKHISRKYLSFLKEIFYVGEKTYDVSYIYGTSTMFFSFAGSMIIFVVGVLEIIEGKMTIGVLFVYDNLIDTLFNGISNIASLFFDMHKILVSCDRVDNIINIDCEKWGNLTLPGRVIEKINFNSVSFKYNERYVLKDISFELVRPNAYAIVGKSGIGKSTLLSLLAGFYGLNQGEITINDMNLYDLDIKDIRNRITFVFQEGVLIDGTIKDNICFGIDNCNPKKLERVNEICGVDEMLDRFENGIETYISRDENNISGGQKQRLLLARALLRESDVYVFDESFSHIDKKLEMKIVNSLVDEYPDKMLIFITHNIEMMKEIENITFVVIEDDETVICGKADDILETSNVYRELIKKESTYE